MHCFIYIHMLIFLTVITVVFKFLQGKIFYSLVEELMQSVYLQTSDYFVFAINLLLLLNILISVCEYTSAKRKKFHVLSLLSFLILPVFVSVLIPLLVLPNKDLSFFLLGTFIFLVMIDMGALIGFSKIYFIPVDDWIDSPMCFDANGTHRCGSFFTSAFMEYGRRFLGKIYDMLVRILIFSVGATSGYRSMEHIFYVALVQQFFYFLLLTVITITSFTILLVHKPTVHNILETKEANKRRSIYGTLIKSRIRSYSAQGTSYVERLPVDFDNFIKNLEVRPNVSHIQRRIKVGMLIGFILLYIHNHCITWNHSREYNSTIYINESKLFGRFDSQFVEIERFLYHLFEKTDFNLFCFALLGILLYNRVELQTTVKTQLLNLVLPKRDSNCFCGKLGKSNLETPQQLHNGVTKQKKPIKFPECSNKNGYNVRILNKYFCTESEPCTNTDERLTKMPSRLDSDLTDEEILQLLSVGQLKTRELEAFVGNTSRAVELRRNDLSRLLTNPHVLERLPFKEYDYRLVYGQCCEEVIGYVPLPVGKIGPLLLDGRSHYLALATTEGCLVASTNRGCRAIFLAGGVKSVVFRDQMTRAPVVWFPSVTDVVGCIAWIESADGFAVLKAAFDKTSSHVNLVSIFANPVGRYLHIRFAARTGDAMGMNMISKAADSALRVIKSRFSSMQVISLSGNMCTDKKPAAINTILGRGKSVIAEVRLPSTVIAQILHTTAARLTRLANVKNWTGSSMAGCLGMMGSNAHAANLVAGIFAATGQDLAQVVDASACLTHFETDSDDSLIASVTMPCLEVGTVGGGTRLPAQRACLELLDLCVDRPTEHLARLIAGAVLAGELSLMAALDTDDLVSAHLRLNRAKNTTSHHNSCTGKVDNSENLTLITQPFCVKSDSLPNLESTHHIM